MQVLYIPYLTLKTERIQTMYANVQSERRCLVSCDPADARQANEPLSVVAVRISNSDCSALGITR